MWQKYNSFDTTIFLLKIWWALDGYSNRRIGIQVKRDIKLLSKILQFLNNTVPFLGTVSWPRVPKSMPRTLLTFLGKQKTGFKNLGGVGGLFLFVSKLKKVIFLIYVLFWSCCNILNCHMFQQRNFTSHCTIWNN